jgi:hypothetical protein
MEQYQFSYVLSNILIVQKLYYSQENQMHDMSQGSIYRESHNDAYVFYRDRLHLHKTFRTLAKWYIKDII